MSGSTSVTSDAQRVGLGCENKDDTSRVSTSQKAKNEEDRRRTTDNRRSLEYRGSGGCCWAAALLGC